MRPLFVIISLLTTTSLKLQIFEEKRVKRNLKWPKSFASRGFELCTFQMPNIIVGSRLCSPSIVTCEPLEYF